jgi:hypothetical protein
MSSLKYLYNIWDNKKVKFNMIEIYYYDNDDNLQVQSFSNGYYYETQTWKAFKIIIHLGRSVKIEQNLYFSIIYGKDYCVLE